MIEVLHADAVVQSARVDADRVARRAGVAVRELGDLDEQTRVVHLLSQLWGRAADNPVLPPELLRAFGKAGNYIVGAFAGEELVGGTIGFHSTPERHTLHSHIAGVRPGLTGRAVGYAMKLHQRAWALERGVDIVEWTFDPLVARNAHFNIAKLRAVPVEYLANFYGPITDAVNGGDDTDRLLVRWDLRDPAVQSAARDQGARARTCPHTIAVAIPEDIEALRRTAPDRARQWRHDLRDRLGSMLAAGGRIVGFDREDGYLVDLEETQ